MMSDSIFEREYAFQLPSWRAVGRDACEQRQRDALTAELRASFAREEALGEEKRDLSQHPVTLTQEFEHRVFNSGERDHATDGRQSAVRNCRLPIAIRPRPDEIMPRCNVNTVSRPNLKICD